VTLWLGEIVVFVTFVTFVCFAVDDQTRVGLPADWTTLAVKNLRQAHLALTPSTPL
jgi:hypothetical protein